MIAVEVLEPFRFRTHPRPFGWIPFRIFLRGTLAIDFLRLEKVFAYGPTMASPGSGLRLWIAAAAGRFL
jgi:hypothetical protein